MHIITTSLGLLISSAVLSCLAADIIIESKDDDCRNITSCVSCIADGACTWCVTKSLCTKHLCGNDNVIYSKGTNALLAGQEFCPRVVEPKDRKLVFKTGKKDILSVKLTQIYLHMAFTPWKCKININGKEKKVPAILIGDSVYCEVFEFKNDSEKPYVDGSIRVLWDYNKLFDGSIPFRVCRCDLDPSCTAC